MRALRLHAGYGPCRGDTMISVLLIDDDAELSELLAEYLREEGFQVSHLTDGRSSIGAIAGYDIVVLDIMMPGISGIEILRRIRRESNMPVLMLTARGDEVDRIAGLDLGADDYLTKPCSPGELAARLRAILRRSGTPAGAVAPLNLSSLQIDPGRRTVHWEGTAIELTGAEFGLLEILALRAGQIVSREDLSEFGLGRSLARYDRSIDVHVSAIRQKIAVVAPDVTVILTVRGKGYQLVAL